MRRVTSPIRKENDTRQDFPPAATRLTRDMPIFRVLTDPRF